MTHIPPIPRKVARRITTAEGIYVHAGDLKAALQDGALSSECAEMMPVGKAMGHGGVNILRHVIGYFIATQCDHVPRTPAEKLHCEQFHHPSLVALLRPHG